MERHEAVIHFWTYCDMHEALKDWEGIDPDEILGNIPGNGTVFLKITIEEAEVNG